MHIANIRIAKIKCKIVWLTMKSIQMLPMEKKQQNVLMMIMIMMINKKVIILNLHTSLITQK